MNQTKASFLRSGDLARLTGVSADTLRHYERMGVLDRPVRGANNYRQYPTSAVDRVLLIRRAMTMGFTLRELRQILAVRDRGGSPCRSVRDLAAGKLQDLERQILDMQRMRRDLRSLLTDWDRRLQIMPQGGRAQLLESLSAAAPHYRRKLTSGKKEKR
jgi:DNA-binding transcriptional MerR regulator